MKLLSIKEILCFFVFYIFFFHTSFFLSATESSSQDCVLSIITPHPENTRTEFEAQFIEWHQKKYGRKIFLDWRNVGGASDIIRFIRSEFAAKPDGIGLDIIFGCGIEPYYDLKREGLLAFCDLPDDILKAIPQYCQGIPIWDKDQYWFGCTIASFGILHNLRVIYYNDLPLASQWKELTNPALCDWIGISDPRNSGSMYTMLEAILQFYGWEEGWKILAGIAANTATIGRYATDPPRQTTYGDTASSICIDFYGSTQVTAVGKTNMSFIIPKDFTILSPDGIAMLKGGKNPLEANHFIEFVLGEKGQKLWMFPAGAPDPKRPVSQRGLDPVRSGLFDPSRLAGELGLCRPRQNAAGCPDRRLPVHSGGAAHPVWRVVLAGSGAYNLQIAHTPFARCGILALGGERL